MAFNKKLYKSDECVVDSSFVYDDSQKKLQNTINSEVNQFINNYNSHPLVYTSLLQLNLSGTPTMAQIYTAMVNGSIAIFHNLVIDQTGMTLPEGSNAPASVVTIIKINSTRGMAFGGRAYDSVTTAKANVYYAAWDGSKFIGWKMIYTNDGSSIGSTDVYDNTQGKSQNTINSEVNQFINNYNSHPLVYTSLSQLNLSGTPTMAQIYTAMVNGSIAIFDNGVIDQTALTIPDGSGNVASLVMFVKVGDYRGYALGGRAYNGVSVGAANFYYAAWDGTKFVGWRKVLTSDMTVPVASGGTGASTANANYVFAGPSSGSSAAAPSFRKLVANDIPDHSTIINKLNGLDYYIRNKKIAIFGDSISDEDIQWSTTVNNVWVKSFRTICSPYSPTITNYSRSSRGFCVKDNNGTYTGQEIIANTDFSSIDTVIIFMGVNDYLNGTWFGRPSGTASGQLWTALNAIANKIKTKNVFVITPMFTSSSGRFKSVSLDMYRICLANWAIKNNFMLINGTRIPKLFKGSSYFDDGLHPKNAYTSIMAQHIFEKMISGGETFECANEVIDITLSNTAHAKNIRMRYKATLEDVTTHVVATATAGIPAGEVNIQTISSVWRYIPQYNNGSILWAQIQGNSGTATSPGGSLCSEGAGYIEFTDLSSAEVLGQGDI